MSAHAFTRHVAFARALGSLTLALAVLVGGIAIAAPRPRPATLTGVAMEAPDGIPAGSFSVAATCNPSGTSTITYSASGTIPAFPDDPSGPYPGTFTATGTITIGPQTGAVDSDGYPSGRVLSWNVSFQIDSGDTLVTGTKQLPRRSTAIGWCRDLQNQSARGLTNASGPYYYASTSTSSPAVLDYTATLETPQGTYGDSGRSDSFFSWVVVDGTATDGSQTRHAGVVAAEYLTSKQRNTR